jgi:hypothetical protein
MRSLRYAVLGIAPLLAAGGFAQGLSVGVKDDAFMQAQAGGPMGSERPTNVPMSEDGKGNTAAGSPAATNQDKAPASAQSSKSSSTSTQSGKQARKGKKQQPKESGG